MDATAQAQLLQTPQVFPPISNPPVTPTPTPTPAQSPLLQYAKILGTPVDLPASIVSSLICTQDTCSRGVVLTAAVALGWYGFNRKDILGYILIASAVSAAYVAMADTPPVVVAVQPTRLNTSLAGSFQ